MHTGPTASPENSYLLKQATDSPFFKPRHVRVITHSPNIDMGVLRQISNIYSLAFSWVQSEQNGISVFQSYLLTPEYATDQQLSERLKASIMRMPNGAIPAASAETSSRPRVHRYDTSTESRADTSNSFMSSLMKTIRTRSPKGSSNTPRSHFILDEYHKTPLSNHSRQNMENYPASDRFDQ